MLDEFESREGRIKSQFWCANIEAAAVLTDRDRFFSAGDPFRTSADMPIARLTDHADRLPRLAEELLIGPARRSGLELVYALETSALNCMDELAARPPPDAKAAKEMRAVTVAKLGSDLAVAKSYVESAAERRAQLIYLQGMLVGVVVTGVVASLLAVLVGLLQDPIDGTEFIPTALLLGALGAVVSVMQRLTRGNLRLRLDSGVTAVRLLGSFRPAIGGLLACAILVMVLGLDQRPVAAVAEDVGHSKLVRQSLVDELAPSNDVVRPGRLDVGRDGQPQDLDEHGPLGADRPTAAATGLVVRRSVATTLHRLSVHRRQRLAAVEEPDEADQTGHRRRPHAVRPPAPPLLPDRAPRRIALGQVAPLAAGPGEEEHRVDHLPAVDPGRRTPAASWVEQVGDKAPLLVGERDAEGHARSVAGLRVT